MPTTLDLVDGQTATLRLPDEVPERRRQAVLDALFPLYEHQAALAEIQAMIAGGVDPSRIGIDGDQMRATVTALRPLIESVIVAFVKEWPYGKVDVDTLLDEVPAKVYEQLRDVTLPQFSEIVPRFDVDSAVTGTTAEGAPIIDRQSPTPPSAG